VSSPELQASKTEIPNIDKATGAQAVFKKSRLLFSIDIFLSNIVSFSLTFD
jgi:hypothetical protein